MILTGYFSVFLWIDLMTATLNILEEAMFVWGPDFRGSFYDILFLDWLVIWPLYRLYLFTSFPIFWVRSFAHTTWSASKASYDRLRGAGNKA
jgi:hypothetical protein